MNLKHFFVILSFAVFLFSQQTSKENTLKLDLNTFLDKVKNNYQDIEVSAFDPKISKAQYKQIRDVGSPLLLEIKAFHNQENGNSQVFFGENAGSWTENLNELRQMQINLIKGIKATGTTIIGSYQRDFSKQFQIIETTNYKDAFALTLQQNLLRQGFPGFQGAKELNLARDNVRLSRAIYNSVLEQYIFLAVSTYWNYQLTKKLYKIQASSLEDNRKLLGQNKRKARIGSIEKSTLYDTEVLVIQTEASLEEIKKVLFELKEKLLNFMGLEEGRLEMSDDLVFVEEAYNLKNIYENMSKNNKRLEQTKLQHRLAKNALKIAKLNRIPQLDLQASLFFQFSTNDGTFNAEEIFRTHKNPDFYLGLNFQAPLDITKLKTITEKARLEYDKSVANLEKIKGDIFLEAKEKIRNIEYLAKITKKNQEALKVMSKRRAEYRKNFEQGRYDLQRYIDADTQFRIWQQRYLQGLLSYKLAGMEMNQLEGKLLSSFNIDELDINSKIK